MRIYLSIYHKEDEDDTSIYESFNNFRSAKKWLEEREEEQENADALKERELLDKEIKEEEENG